MWKCLHHLYISWMYCKSICDALKVSLALITSAPPTVLGPRFWRREGKYKDKMTMKIYQNSKWVKTSQLIDSFVLKPWFWIIFTVFWRPGQLGCLVCCCFKPLWQFVLFATSCQTGNASLCIWIPTEICRVYWHCVHVCVLAVCVLADTYHLPCIYPHNIISLWFF